MKLHVFNPEHDIALATNLANFTAPLAGRALRADLGFIPALWASEGDAVLVENVDDARQRYEHLAESVDFHRPMPLWVTNTKVSSLDLDAVEPWGWDLAIRSQLLRYGVEENLLPSVDEIGEIRNLSHRRHAAEVLRQLQHDGLTGEAFCCTNIGEIEEFMRKTPKVVLKAPWSSSGRGIRFVCGGLTPALRGWVENLLHTQGSVMLEPFYEKTMDFAMEFCSEGAGAVTYSGLSLFATVNGAYTGNMLAEEEEKEEILTHYVSKEILIYVREKIIQLTSSLFQGKYRGPFGVDMMVCKNGLLHPCVEINLRRTMGHVALSLSPYKKGRLAICSKSPFQLLVE
jgi:hypothetical protein